ncbi:pyruvate decarboxylase [Gautieria morchelliformis]|nr:pyruvate decarboxylase [Gautieria morchelliformis]
MAANEGKITIGQYLLTRLEQLHVKSMFGVPGDFNLGFLDLIEDHKTIDWVGNCNELNAAYAADGFARVAQSVNSRTIGVVVTTFGVGELSAINGIAGAFSEHIPVLHIVGVPSTVQQKTRPLLHHSLGDGRFDAYTKAAEQVTASQAVLMDTQTAASQIDRILKECVIWSRPVYLALPTDLVDAYISSAPLQSHFELDPPLNDKDIESYVLDEIVRRVDNAGGDVALLVDACAIRHRVVPELHELMHATGFPIYSTPMGKSIVPEDYERFGGIYTGAITQPAVLNKVESAKLIISVGALKSDFNTGNFTYHVPPTATVELHSDHTKIGYAMFPDIRMKYLIPKLSDRLKQYSGGALQVSIPKWRNVVPDEHTDAITHAWLWPKMGSFFRPKDVIVAETGTSSFGAPEIALPRDTIYVSQILWGSIGWAVGSALGAAIAAKQRGLGRTCLFVGDGSLQLTVQELSTMIREKVRAIIFVINNKGYTIERYIHGMERKYNDVADWRCTSLLSTLGGIEDKTCRSYTVRNKGELSTLLEDETFGKADGIQLVELIMDKFDAPETLKREVEMSQKASSYSPN